MQKHLYLAAFLTAALITLAIAPIPAQAQSGGPFTLPHSDPDMAPPEAYAQLDRQSGIKQALKLSIEQEKLWGPVEEALRNLREQRGSLRSAMTANESADQLVRLRRRTEVITQRANALKKLADAVQPLWATFSEEQKRQLTQTLSIGPQQIDQEHRISRRQDEDDDGGMHRRHHRWHYKDQDRTYRDRRDVPNRMMGRRGYDDHDDDYNNTRRDRFDRYQHRWSHDDFRPRARRFEHDRYDYDHHAERDYCRCGRRY